MAQKSKASSQKRGISAATVGVGLAGAVAGATVGMAFADEKVRKKVRKLAVDAQNAFQRLMEVIESEAQDRNVDETVKKAKSTAKKVQKTAKQAIQDGKKEIRSRT